MYEVTLESLATKKIRIQILLNAFEFLQHFSSIENPFLSFNENTHHGGIKSNRFLDASKYSVIKLVLGKYKSM